MESIYGYDLTTHFLAFAYFLLVHKGEQDFTFWLPGGVDFTAPLHTTQL